MIQLEELNVDNWLKATELKVSKEQKAFPQFPMYIGSVSADMRKEQRYMQ